MPLYNDERDIIDEVDKTLPDIFAREEDADHDVMNEDTFDTQNDALMCSGHFDLSEQIFAREEDAKHDALNNDTFDPHNDFSLCFGNFEFSQREHVKIPERPKRSEYYYTTPDDCICSCGFHVASQLSAEEKSNTGLRLYIPRLRVNDPSFQRRNSLYYEVTWQLETFCNIVSISLQNLERVNDVAAYVFLNPDQPFRKNKMGQTAMCNLSCPKCKSLTVQINPNIFWKVFPQM